MSLNDKSVSAPPFLNPNASFTPFICAYPPWMTWPRPQLQRHGHTRRGCDLRVRTQLLMLQLPNRMNGKYKVK
ncbi:hypothetical protein JHK82_040240 [Glycine max]|uniref:Uncharacterized protein n=1 Tax=Glycine max TaxID=3847 RepID=K7M7G7_SOYBN|nr:hypothetical protein JHK87_040251 [Glycine soja]KAG4966047.1 hypothetical protein JHK85_041022 [Glycine max]KAG5111017.1 hypothetical protein JHK82_040240 [Glycine max]KAG5122307.1 hypothetical protein JHK84_040647 [Glycine max]KAH1094902.1 hypothetical protein GYH30_040277 [Glycine max]